MAATAATVSRATPATTPSCSTSARPTATPSWISPATARPQAMRSTSSATARVRASPTSTPRTGRSTTTAAHSTTSSPSATPPPSTPAISCSCERGGPERQSDRAQETVTSRRQPLELHAERRVEPIVIEYVPRASVRDDASCVHHDDLVEKSEGEVEIVHHDDGKAIGRARHQCLHHVHAVPDVEAGGRLVRQQGRRIHGQHHGQ